MKLPSSHLSVVGEKRMKNNTMTNIQIKANDLNLDECMQLAANDEAGGICFFVGTVRNQTKGKKVVSLQFEAYEKMAISEMQKIADHLIKDKSINRVVIHHRVGDLSVGEIPVIIVVAAPHRKAAFEACQYAIDTLKETVPIWKKEIFENGEVWVSAHP